MDTVVRPESGRPSRRTVIGAAVWSVPVIAVATATPAFAASTTPTLSFTRFTVTGGRRIRVSFAVRVTGATSVSASLAIQLWDANGAQLGSVTRALTLSPTSSGRVTFNVPATAGADHATATLTSPGLQAVSATASL